MANVSQALSEKLWAEAAYPGDTVIPYSPDYLRYMMGAVWNVAGVVQPGDFNIQQHGTGDWSLDVTAGSAVLPGYTSAEKYFFRSTATVNVPITGINTSPVATRTHKVYLAGYDKNYAGSAYGAKIFIGEDTGSGAPTPTDNPVGYISLGTFTIAPSQASILTTHITPLPPYAGFAGTWRSLPLAAGFIDGSTSSAHSPQYRKIGNTVEMRGMVNRTSNAQFAATFYTVASLPTAIRPTGTLFYYLPVATSQPVNTDTPLARALIHNNGDLTMEIGDFSGANQPITVLLDGIRYDVA